VAFCWIENLNTGAGMAQMDGTPIERRLAQAAERRSVWINDSYWMLMPYKDARSGVTLQYAGDERANGLGQGPDGRSITWATRRATPRVYVNRKSTRRRWDMVLQDDQPPQTWRRLGGTRDSCGSLTRTGRTRSTCSPTAWKRSGDSGPRVHGPLGARPHARPPARS
jgi:hypothetical protein